jgi:hypothetical protein
VNEAETSRRRRRRIKEFTEQKPKLCSVHPCFSCSETEEVNPTVIIESMV